MNKLVLCLTGLVAVAMSQQFCDLCKKMITNEQVFRNYYFKNITEAQLKVDMDNQCDKETSGIENTFCKQLINDDSALLLADLKANDTSLKCCQDGKLSPETITNRFLDYKNSQSLIETIDQIKKHHWPVCTTVTNANEIAAAISGYVTRAKYPLGQKGCRLSPVTQNCGGCT